MLQRSGISVVELGFQVCSLPVTLRTNFKVHAFPIYDDLLPNLQSWFDMEDKFMWYQTILRHTQDVTITLKTTLTFKILVYFVWSHKFWLSQSTFLLAFFGGWGVGRMCV